MKSQNTKIHRIIFALKWAVAAVAVYFILHRLRFEISRDWWGAFVSDFREGKRIAWFISALLLLPFNWGLEALKWQRMISKLEPVSYLTAYRAVLSGLVVSTFTPNRSGEYIGRIFVLERTPRVTAILATIGENFAQLLVTLIVGAIALLFFSFFGTPFALGSPLWPLLVLVCIVLTILYFRFPALVGWLSRKRMFSRLQATVEALAAYSRRDLAVILLLSFIRYAVFSFQFYFLLVFFRVDLPVASALICIAVVFLGLAVFPTFTLTELGVRCSTADLVFSRYTPMVEQVVFATSVLWVINIILPSLVGCALLYRLKLHRNG